MSAHYVGKLEKQEHLILECEGVKKECDIIKKCMEEREGDIKWSEKTVIEKMHMKLGLGEYVEVKDIKILETVGSMLYKRNKEW